MSRCRASQHYVSLAALPGSFYDPVQVKMSISHALAQSSKLAVYEDRMGGLINEVR